MKRLLIIFVVAFLAATALGQTVTKIELAKDNGKGQRTKVVKDLATTDNPFHCVVHLKALTSKVTFTGTLIAVDASGVKNFKVASTDLESKVGMDLVDFKFSLPRPWPTGSYKVEVKADGRLLKDIAFKIK